MTREVMFGVDRDDTYIIVNGQKTIPQRMHVIGGTEQDFLLTTVNTLRESDDPLTVEGMFAFDQNSVRWPNLVRHIKLVFLPGKVELFVNGESKPVARARVSFDSENETWTTKIALFLPPEADDLLDKTHAELREMVLEGWSSGGISATGHMVKQGAWNDD